MFIPKVPDNSLKEKIEKIIYIAQKAETSEEYDSAGIIFKFYPPATEAELKKVEMNLNVKLDEDYKNFLMFTNGAMLCSTTARFYNTERLISVNRTITEDIFSENYIIIAELIGDGEILCYLKDTQRYISYFEGKKTEYLNFSDCLDEIIRMSKDSVEEFVDF